MVDYRWSSFVCMTTLVDVEYLVSRRGSIFSTIASEALQAIFTGGSSRMPGVITPFIARLNIASNRVQWRRYYTSTGTNIDTVSGMAISPDGSNIAVHG